MSYAAMVPAEMGPAAAGIGGKASAAGRRHSAACTAMNVTEASSAS